MSAARRVLDLAALGGECTARSIGGGAAAACSRTRVRGASELTSALGAARLACFPTDTVYGVGGLCRPEVVEALWAAKGRDPEKPLQVIFPTLPTLFTTLEPPPRLAGALRRLLPGRVTLVVPYPEGFEGPPPGRDTAGSPTLGVRVPRWPPAAVAMSWIGAPLIASSANPSGDRPARHLGDVDPALAAACDLLLDGGEVPGTASTVIDLSAYADEGRWSVLREGALDAAALTAALGEPPEGGMPPQT